MRKTIILILLAVTLIFVPGVCAADAPDSDLSAMQLPGSIEVEKKTDMTLGMIANVFGDPFKEISGAESGASGGFSKLVLDILGILNMLAMIYVGAAVVYLWVIFAATTAHQGEKLGGGVYDSLWVPIRQAGAFTLTVPIINGLSVMQVMIMACISLSINFANVIWDGAGNYMVEHANIGLIDTAPMTSESEIYKLLPEMFKASVLQQIDLSVSDSSEAAFTLKSANENGMIMYPVGFASSGDMSKAPPEDEKGLLMYSRNTKKGYVRLAIRVTDHMEAEKVGEIFISYPAGKPNDSISYRLAAGIANIKTNFIIGVYGRVYRAATVYLNSRASSSGDSGCAIAPYGSKGVCYPATVAEDAIKETIDDVAKTIKTVLAPQIAAFIKTEKSQLDDQTEKEALSAAIDSKDGKSLYGWASAGLFPYALSMKQKELNDGLASAVWVTDGSSAAYTKSLKSLSSVELSSKLFTRNYRAALSRAPAWFSSIAAKNKAYSSRLMAGYLEPEGDSDSLFQIMKREILSTFLTGKNSSLIGVTLAEMRDHDPVVVLQSFGSKLLASMQSASGLSAGAVSTVIMGTSFTILLALFLLGVGTFFAYVIPIVPVIFWMQALVSWLFMVVEAMVAAPFWVCTHVLPEGKGFAGEHARKGYMLLLEVMARPVLLVVGVIFAIAVCQITGWLFSNIFSLWFNTVGGEYIELGFMADIIYTILLISMMYYVYYTVFTKGISYMPEKVLGWCGAGSGMGLSDQEGTLREIMRAGGALSAMGVAGATTKLVRKPVDSIEKRVRDRLLGKKKEEKGKKGAVIPQIKEKEDTKGASPPLKRREALRTPRGGFAPLDPPKGKGEEAVASQSQASRRLSGAPERGKKENPLQKETDPIWNLQHCGSPIDPLPGEERSVPQQISPATEQSSGENRKNFNPDNKASFAGKSKAGYVDNQKDENRTNTRQDKNTGAGMGDFQDDPYAQISPLEK